MKDYLKGKLRLCILTFTLIINLTHNFRKYNAIPSYLKKRTPKYPHHLKTRKMPLMLLEKITPMYFDFHFNYKFDPRFYEIQCNNLTFEKVYGHIPSSKTRIKTLRAFAKYFQKRRFFKESKIQSFF